MVCPALGKPRSKQKSSEKNRADLRKVDIRLVSHVIRIQKIIFRARAQADKTALLAPVPSATSDSIAIIRENAGFLAHTTASLGVAPQQRQTQLTPIAR